MLYALNDEVLSITANEVDKKSLITGLVNKKEVEKICKKLNFSKKMIEQFDFEEKKFEERMHIYDEYVFIKIRLGKLYLTLVAGENLFLVGDDSSNSSSEYRDLFFDFIDKISCENISAEKLIYLFFESVFDIESVKFEKAHSKIKEMEKAIENGRAQDKINLKIMGIKNMLMDYRRQYNEINDAMDFLREGFLESKNLKYFKLVDKKVQKLKEEIDVLSDNVIHLRDAYQSYLELNLNSIMKTLTVLTSIFSPLTLISSWYGMNFHNMPIVEWKYGYLSIAVVSFLILIIVLIVFKKKKLI